MDNNVFWTKKMQRITTTDVHKESFETMIE